MNNFQKALLELALTRPRKLPAMFRLATGARRFAPAAYRNKEHLAPPPVTISIRPTYRCNLNCKMCGQWGERGALVGTPKDTPGDELSTEEILSFIDQVAWFRPYLFFTGGEPTLRHDLAKMIAHAHRRNLLTSLNTNATTLSSKAEEIIEAGLDYLFVSLDGPPKVDDRIRIGHDSAERAFRGIQAVLDLKRRIGTRLPMVQVQTTLTEDNQDHLLETAEYFQQYLNIDTWGLVPGVFTTPELSVETSRVYKERWGIDQKYWAGFIRDVSRMKSTAIHEQIDAIMARKWRFRFRPYPPIGSQGFRFHDWFENPARVLADAHCTTAYVFTQLQPNGDLATCGSQPDFVAGNIRHASFMEIWNGAKYRSFRAFLKESLFPSCARCWALYEFYLPSGLSTKASGTSSG